MTFILGISAFYHDAAAALLADGEIVAASQEERFSRKKYDARFPARAIEACLAEAGIGPERLDYVVFYDQPLTKFERLIESYVAYAPAGFASFRRAMPTWLKQKLHVRREIHRGLGGGFRGPILFTDHHEAHSASAFFPSPFEEAATLTMDGVGEWSTTTIGHGSGHRLQLLEQIRFPHSVGLLYSAFTYYCGFAVNSGEHKLMGLAPYGEPRFVDSIYEHLIDLRPDGSYHMDMTYFPYCHGLTMTGPTFHALFGGPPRDPDDPLEQRHLDLAASIQRVCEDVVLRSAAHAWERTGRPKALVMAGGVALNCVANGRVAREGPFERVWVQPAAGDAGGALGAALFTWHHLLEQPRRVGCGDRQRLSWLGPRYTGSEIEPVLESLGARYRRFEDEKELLDEVVKALVDGQTVGWFQGRSEFGPRALGSRSILGDARRRSLQSELNRKVKFRETFRPFAPSVLREHAHEWFAVAPGEDSPYMLFVVPVRAEHRTPLSPADESILRSDPDLSRRVSVPRSGVPAVTHVDYSARIQTVDERHGLYYRLLKRFYEVTGCPILVNTSFNLSWEPIVETPRDAYHTFMQSQIDTLVLENCVLRKAEQPLGMEVRLEAGVTPAAAATPWADPRTGEALVLTESAAVNPVSGARFPVDGGILRLFAAEDGPAEGEDVTGIVRSFYEETPFPNYEGLDSPRKLLEKSRAGLFARLLNEQIPYGARVLDVGCGTGQLTNFLAIAHRTVVGVDASLASLRLAQQFKTTFGIHRSAFAQMNLFRPGVKAAFFDVVISLGVLHHTRDAEAAFGRIARLVRPGGYILVGLYSRMSRLFHAARRAVYKWTGFTSRWLDPRLAENEGTAARREAWFRDQYCHPHETTHTVDEVMAWMKNHGFRFINCIPKARFGDRLTAAEQLFMPSPPATRLERSLSQMLDLGGARREGGFFIVIGQHEGGS